MDENKSPDVEDGTYTHGPGTTDAATSANTNQPHEAPVIDDVDKLPEVDISSTGILQEAGVEPEGGIDLSAEDEAIVLRPIKPGVERWSVKTGTDDDVAKVKQVRVKTTVKQLVAIPRPRDMMPVNQDFAGYSRHRAEPVETTIWEITGQIVMHKLEDDGDYHLVILDQGKTMVVEIPNPDPAFVDPSSPWVKAIASARKLISDTLDPQRFLQSSQVQARIVGVGFFDRVHGAQGSAQTNGIELHPVLGVKLNPSNP
jgi:hypothetical protein